MTLSGFICINQSETYLILAFLRYKSGDLIQSVTTQFHLKTQKEEKTLKTEKKILKGKVLLNLASCSSSTSTLLPACSRLILFGELT